MRAHARRYVIERRAEHGVPRAPGVFRDVEGHVGAAQQFFLRAAVGGAERDADAGAAAVGDATQHCRLRERLDDA